MISSGSARACVQIASAETALLLEGDAASGLGSSGKPASAVFIRAPAAISVGNAIL